jgi:hypothetical protein
MGVAWQAGQEGAGIAGRAVEDIVFNFGEPVGERSGGIPPCKVFDHCRIGIEREASVLVKRQGKLGLYKMVGDKVFLPQGEPRKAAQ